MTDKATNLEKPNVLLNIVCFIAVLVFTPITYYTLAVPAMLIGLPVAIFAKSTRTKWLAVSVLMGAVTWIFIYMVAELFK